MRRWTGYAALVAFVAMGLLLADQHRAEAQKEGKKRAATIKQLMKGICGSNCGALSNGLKAGPKTDKDWEAIELHAALLNELSYTLMADGRCPDAVWKKACDGLREQSAAVLAAADKHDTDAANAAFKKLTKSSCAVCHPKHK